MKTDTDRNIGRRFSAAAPTYSGEAVIQEKVAGQLIQLVKDSCRQPAEILELGCGTGLLTRKLSALYPEAHITAVDISDKMITQAGKECCSCKNINWVSADAVGYASDQKADLIISSSALHWMHPMEKTISNAFKQLRQDGRMCFGMMTNETLKELHESRKAAVPGKIPERVLPSSESVMECMTGCGFLDITAMTVNEVLYYPDTRALLESLHKLGVTGGSISGSGTLLTASELKALIRHMDGKYGKNNVPASYQVLYVSAGK